MRNRTRITVLVISILSLDSAILQSQSSIWRAVDDGLQKYSHLSGLTFVDENTGWLIADTSTILRSTDGGSTWKALPADPALRDATLIRVRFADAHTGWAAGCVAGNPALWRTVDGGGAWLLSKKWHRDKESYSACLSDVFFIDAMQGWATGFNGLEALVVATKDGGNTWTTQYSGGEIDSQALRVHFVDAKNGWVLLQSGVMKTKDGGDSWRLSYFGSDTFIDMEVLSATEVWVAGKWDSLLHTKDDGIHWSEVRVPGKRGGSYFGWVRFANKNVGWACGSGGDVVRTKDGGKTWSRQFVPHRMFVKDISTDELAITKAHLFTIARPGRLLVRPVSE